MAIDYLALTGLAGTGLQAYGAYQGAQEQKKQNQAMLQAYQQEIARQRALDEEAKKQQYLENLIGFGNYANNQLLQDQATYGGYNRSIGR
jgi:hypothetical protein